MNPVFHIALDEWRYWRRSRLGAAATLVTLVLLVASSVVTYQTVTAERQARDQLQDAAQSIFLDQPARHPHRMVHYGHYAFRTPPPLALADPGVDQFTGAAVFLEGHRQNSATFSPAYSGPQGIRFANLSPATVYQVLVPLLLVVVGFSAFSRERELRTDQMLLAAPVGPGQIWLGKTLALVGLALVLLLPLLLLVLLIGEDRLAGLVLVAGYAVYLLVWASITVSVSARSRASSSSLVVLLALWLAVCIVVPRGASTAAQALLPIPSKVETDLAVADAVRNLGDGHNAGDPAFARLRANLLAEYGVDRVEDLPVNFRGVVAEASEADLTKVMDDFAERYAGQELAQAQLLRWASVLSPMLALRAFSTTMAGTDLAHRHQFLREAEAIRYEFVQGLNRAHASELTYSDDMQRSRDAASEKRTRVSPTNWATALKEFHLQVNPASERWQRAFPYLLLLAVFAALAAGLGLSRRTAKGWA
ncbi:MAG: DUF3526 domain-containing protein [Pseudomonadota bacterium]